MDYGMEEGRAQINVRRALLFYALKRLGLDTDPAARRPQDQQIVLINREAILGRPQSAEEQ
ncbi:MAG: WYL domain-containing protein, partial [Natronohydrobacter sp.]|nr:WYL domain-containing protein [Natronohydrobacter sp.]